MLRKLIKYDIKSVAPIWCLMAVVVACMAVFGSVVARVSIEAMERVDIFALLPVFGMLLAGLCAVVVVSSPFVTMFLVYWRFYKNFFTDEGYLTFTLPVSRRQLMLSKVINAMIWMLAHGVLLVFCLLIACWIVPPTFGDGLFNTVIFEGIGRALRGLWELGGAWTILWTLEILVGLLVSTLFSVGCFHLCITIGSVVAKKAKLLAAIGIYYLSNMVITTASQLFTTLILPHLIPGVEVLLRDAPQAAVNGATTLMVGIVIAVFAAAACAVHFAAMDMVERKLNLP